MRVIDEEEVLIDTRRNSCKQS